MEIPIHEELRGGTLAEYLALLWPDRSQQALAALFASGRIRSRGKPVSPARNVVDLSDLELAGDLSGVPSIPLGEAGEHEALELLHEDDRLVVVSKPSGLPVVPDRGQRAGSVLGALIRRELEARTGKLPGRFLRYRIVHRIDRLTSGLVIVAKTAEVERGLASDFENRRVRKEYLAILSGELRPARVTVDCPVVPGRKGKMRAEAPKDAASFQSGSALTEFETIERLGGFTLVRARPRTGRTHQIRVHAWACGCPLAIDPLYGPPRDSARPPGIDRLTLHALRYELPGSWEEPRSFECPLADDFAAALRELRAAAGK